MHDSHEESGPDSLRREVSQVLDGQFTLGRVLGRGGMGVVYLAHDLKLDRPVALKVLPTDGATDPVARDRFVREARTAARLAHPNIVPVYRADEIDGIAFFTMGFIDGESLGERVRDRGPLHPADAVRVLREAAWALAYAHARGVVHRDVKPENILIERSSGRTLVTDFGIARRTDVESPSITQSGAVLGTFHFMSPEQVADEPLDGRSDLYSLGVVAFYLLSGRLPFAEFAGPAVLLAHATRPAPLLASVAPSVPASLAQVVDRCLAKRPDARYATGEALAEALEQSLAVASLEARVDANAFAQGLPAVLSEGQAAAIWQRAAQLQAEALHERRTQGDVLPPATRPDGTPPDGYAIEHVIAAAEEVGISRRYVAMAVAELPSAGGGMMVPAVSEGRATFYLGTDARSISVSYIIPAPPARVFRVLGRVLQQAPYDLRLRETVGAHPLDGGVIVFDLTSPIVGPMGAPEGTVNVHWMGTRQQLEARQLQVTLRALPRGTEVTMTCDLRPGVRSNVRWAQWMSGVMGSFTGIGTGALLAKGGLAVLGATVLGPAAAVGILTTALTLLGYRPLYRGALARARGEMLGALEALGAAVQSEELFDQR